MSLGLPVSSGPRSTWVELSPLWPPCLGMTVDSSGCSGAAGPRGLSLAVRYGDRHRVAGPPLFLSVSTSPGCPVCGLHALMSKIILCSACEGGA